MLQQIHRKTPAQKTQSKEDVEARVQLTGGKTQRPPRLRPVKYGDDAASDDEDDVDSDENDDDQYSGGESGQRVVGMLYLKSDPLKLTLLIQSLLLP